MKKITLVILLAFLAINCSNDDSNTVEFKKETIKTVLIEKRNEMNYPIINQDSKDIGNLTIFDDKDFLYFNCTLNSDYTFSEIGLFAGKYENLPSIEANQLHSNYTLYEKYKDNSQSKSYKINKISILTDENKCAFITTIFSISNLKANTKEIAWSSSNHLPSLTNSKFYLYCIQ